MASSVNLICGVHLFCDCDNGSTGSNEDSGSNTLERSFLYVLGFLCIQWVHFVFVSNEGQRQWLNVLSPPFAERMLLVNCTRELNSEQDMSCSVVNTFIRFIQSIFLFANCSAVNVDTGKVIVSDVG